MSWFLSTLPPLLQERPAVPLGPCLVVREGEAEGDSLSLTQGLLQAPHQVPSPLGLGPLPTCVWPVLTEHHQETVLR